MGIMWIKTNPPKYHAGQWFATAVVSGCFFTNGMAMAWTSSAFAKVLNKKVDFTLEQYQMTLITALGFGGRILSPVPMSYMMDLIGRKSVLILVRILQLAHWLMLYSSYNVWVMYSARLICGWYGGTIMLVMPLYIAETTHKTVRGKAQAIMQTFFLLGAVFESAVGPFVSYGELILASAGIDLFLIFFMLMIPETPYHHLMTGSEEKATVALQWLRGSDVDITAELARIEMIMMQQLENRNKYSDIFSTKPLRKAFAIAICLMVIQRFSGMTTIVPYASFIFVDTWWLPNEKGPILLNCTYLIMCTVSGLLVDSWGRKNFLFISGAGSSVFMTGCALWFYFRHMDYNTSGTEWIIVVFLVLQAAFYSTGFYYIPSLVASEMFPINIKAKANAITTTVAVIVSTLVSSIFLPLSDNFGLYTNFCIYALANFIGASYSLTIIETKGKSLEAIQATLQRRQYSSTTGFGSYIQKI